MHLVVLSFVDGRAAEQVFELTQQLCKQDLLPLDDIAWVERRADGGITLHQLMRTTGANAVSGAMWGTLAGLLFLAPAEGSADGDHVVGDGALADVGIPDSFVRNVSVLLRAGGGAVMVLAGPESVGALVEALRPYGASVQQTVLGAADGKELIRALKV